MAEASRLKKVFWATRGLLALFLLGFGFLDILLRQSGLASAAKPPQGEVVFFNANWCASCQDVLPIAKEIALQHNLQFVDIDVDTPTAPKVARHMGLTIPNDEPPQVFFVGHGHSLRLYNGKNFQFGYDEKVKSTILRSLQSVLPEVEVSRN